MRTDNYNNLSKSSVGSSISFKKSPSKFMVSQVRPQDYSYMERSVAYPPNKDWVINGQEAKRKTSDDFKDLRNTFDARTNTKLQQTLYRSTAYGVEDSSIPYNKYENFSKTQYYSKPNSPGSQLTGSSAYDRAIKKEEPYPSYTSKYEKTAKSPVLDKKIDIEQKYKQYA